MIQLSAGARVVLMILMASNIDNLALFPLVFASLVLQKTYLVSKSALVPSTVRTHDELVEANSKLGLIAGITGAVAVVPAGILLKLAGAPATLWYGAIIFGAAVFAATRLPPEVVAEHDADQAETNELAASSLQLGAIAMTVLRAIVGFTFFHLAFWLRSQDHGAVWFGAVVGVAALASIVGNAIAPKVRQRLSEESMLTVCLLVSAGTGLAVSVLGGPVGAVVLAAILNLAAALGRLSFESMVQRDAPGANQGRAFARFESRFQLAWAVGAFIAVAVQVPGKVGFLIVGVVAGVTMLYVIARRNGRDFSGRSLGRAKGQAPRSRSASGWPKPR